MDLRADALSSDGHGNGRGQALNAIPCPVGLGPNEPLHHARGIVDGNATSQAVLDLSSVWAMSLSARSEPVARPRPNG